MAIKPNFMSNDKMMAKSNTLEKMAIPTSSPSAMMAPPAKPSPMVM